MSSIAVVVPTYNRPDRLGRLLCALDRQEGLNSGFDIVVVDDGSSVNLAEVAGRHGNVRLLQQDNAGPATARNRGWRATNAEIVAFTDDDTVPSPLWLADLAAAFEADSALDAVGGEVVPIVPGFLADFVGLEGLVNHGTNHDGDVKYLITANMAIRRHVLAATDGFDETFQGASGEDTEFTRRLIAGGYSVSVLDAATVAHEHRSRLTDVLATYRRHGASRRKVLGPQANLSGRKRHEVLSFSHWAHRYHRYRAAGCSRSRSTAYLALRCVGMFAYISGMIGARRESAAAS